MLFNCLVVQLIIEIRIINTKLTIENICILFVKAYIHFFYLIKFIYLESCNSTNRPEIAAKFPHDPLLS